jgi:tryptophan-rich sensory protein
MTELASVGQLRGSLLRWALVTVPGVLLLGYLSAAIGSADGPWFTSLVKPSLFPPPVTFGIVWSVLYIVMGLALAIVAAARGARRRGVAVMAFAVQLLLNLAWSPLFFAGHQILGALALIVVLDIVLIVTIAVFWRVRPLAALLLVPYLAWLLFATLLNWQFHAVNPDADGRAASGAVQRMQI